MSAPGTGPAGLNTTPIFGPRLLGCIFASMFWGISCMQLFMYFNQYRSDTLALKTFVILVWAVDTAVLGMEIAALFPSFVTQWGALDQVIYVQPLLLHRTWLVAFVTIPVQLFFLHRIYRIGRRTAGLLAVLITLGVLSLYQLVGSAVYAVWGYQTPQLADLGTPRDVKTEITVRATSAVIDVFIAATLISMLSRSSHSEYQFKRSNTLVNRLIVLTINTGLWTAAFAVISLALARAFFARLNFCYAELPIGSIYINSLLGNLNARNFIRHTDVEFNSLRVPHGDHVAASDELTENSGTLAASSLQHVNKVIRVDTARAIHVNTVNALGAIKGETGSLVDER